MIVDFQTLPETARIWIYQCNRSFSEEEILDISKKLQTFLEGWTAHGADLKAAFGKVLPCWAIGSQRHVWA